MFYCGEFLKVNLHIKHCLFGCARPQVKIATSCDKVQTKDPFNVLLSS